MTNIVLVNASSVLSDDAVAAILPALQKWDNTMLRPAYEFDPCTYRFMSWHSFRASPPPPEAWPIFINNHSSDASALGWHDDQSGRVFGRVFAGDCLRYGISWTVDVSHEAAEMRGDPQINKTFKMADGRVAIYELADAVESDECGIMVDGVLLSDFVLPSYWAERAPAGQTDYAGHLRGACPALAPGGYMSVYDGGQWTQVTKRWIGGPSSYRSGRTHGRVARRDYPVK